MKRHFSYPTENVASQEHYDIKEFCKPYFKRLNLNYFHYFRYYKDGHLFTLNHTKCLDNYYWSKTDTVTLPKGSETCRLDQMNICFWRGLADEQIVESLKNDLGLVDPIALYYSRKDYIEIFTFSSPTDEKDNFLNYMNHIPELQAMALDFTLHFKALIDIAHNTRTKAPNLDKFNPLFDTPELEIYLEGKLGRITLSIREIQIIKELIRGKSSREIGETLNRSPRTIETHIDTLKSRAGYRKKSELIACILDQLYVLNLRGDKIVR